MTQIYLDATTLIALGTIGELELLTAFGGNLVVLPAVRDEVTTEPAKTNLDRFLDKDEVDTSFPTTGASNEQAKAILGESESNGDVSLIAAVLGQTASSESVALVSADRRLRTVADGLGARVTGIVGVVIRVVEEGMSAEEAKALVRRVDAHGLHMTAELRETVYDLIEAAAE